MPNPTNLWLIIVLMPMLLEKNSVLYQREKKALKSKCLTYFKMLEIEKDNWKCKCRKHKRGTPGGLI